MDSSATYEEIWDDFILSRKAIRCTQSTLDFYNYNAKPFLSWLRGKNLQNLNEIRARHVREYMAKLASEKRSDWTIHDAGRAIRTFLKFSHEEGYIEKQITYQLPSIGKKELPSLTKEQLKQIIAACNSLRDKVIIMFLADTGTRRAEAIALNWGDINLENGLCKIRHGKGGKFRRVVMGTSTKTVLSEYKRTITQDGKNDPVFQSKTNERFTAGGFLQIFIRLTKRTGIYVGPHALRRTFARLSLRSGMDSLHLQGLMGHASLEMTMRYVGEFDDDELIRVHGEHSPIEKQISDTANE